MTQHQDQYADAGPRSTPPSATPPPDLGFFAGAPQPAGSAAPFGGAPSTFGAPAVNQFGSPAVSQFGGPAVNQFGGPAVNQFGGAMAMPMPAAAPLGASSQLGPIAQLQSSAAGRWALRLGIGLAIALVLGALGVGRFSGLSIFGDDGITTPATLGGLSPSADAAEALETISIGAADQDLDITVQMYGAGADQLLFMGLTGEKSATAEEDFLAGLRSGTDATMGATTMQVGDNMCVTFPGGSLCAHVESDKGVAVVGARPVAAMSALADEAWAAQ